jgi:hypothetical protein
MYRLDNNAFENLRAEVEICKTKDKQGEQKQQIVLQRLEQLRLEIGKRAKCWGVACCGCRCVSHLQRNCSQGS